MHTYPAHPADVGPGTLLADPEHGPTVVLTARPRPGGRHYLLRTTTGEHRGRDVADTEHVAIVIPEPAP